MTQHPEFLKTEELDYAAECRRMAALGRRAERNVSSMSRLLRQWAVEAGQVAARFRQREAGPALATKQPAYG